jgi:glycosyltransferase involved in cell wall biosynthesis
VTSARAPKIGILVVAYNAESTLASVLDRIPTDFRPRISKVLVSDDHSGDDTFRKGVDYLAHSDIPIEVVCQPRNLGYGGNQTAGYHWAIDNDLDVIVMLHGDGQYAPEFLPNMVAPIVDGDADAVFGSRMLDHGSARKGGMPAYKYFGNKTLTKIQNELTGATLSEWHSGYRAYRVAALKDIPFERNDPGFRFDTQIILQLIEGGKKIVEIGIPTFYGDEICYVNGMKYAREIMFDVARYRAHNVGFGSGDLAFAATFDRVLGEPENYVIEELQASPPQRVLNLSEDFAPMSGRLTQFGHEVVEAERLLGVRPSTTVSGVDTRFDDRIDEFELVSSMEGESFDVILAFDLLARVRDPERLLRALHQMLRPEGKMFVSVSNIEHWYSRIRIGAGQFDYDQRGSLDKSHVRLFSKRAMLRLTTRSGWWIRDQKNYGVPFDVLPGRSPKGGRVRNAPRWLRSLDRILVSKWPSLFSYSFLYVLESASPRFASRATSTNPEPSKVDSGVPSKISNRTAVESGQRSPRETSK